MQLISSSSTSNVEDSKLNATAGQVRSWNPRKSVLRQSTSSSSSSSSSMSQQHQEEERPSYSPKTSILKRSNNNNSGRVRNQENSNPKSVSFGTIEIREYPMTIGDNPSVSRGVPLTIEWHYNTKTVKILLVSDLDPTIPHRREDLLLLSSLERARILKDLGYTRWELTDAMIRVQQERQRREETTQEALRELSWGIKDHHPHNTMWLSQLLGNILFPFTPKGGRGQNYSDDDDDDDDDDHHHHHHPNINNHRVETVMIPHDKTLNQQRFLGQQRQLLSKMMLLSINQHHHHYRQGCSGGGGGGSVGVGHSKVSPLNR